jgi:choline dehydrogenase
MVYDDIIVGAGSSGAVVAARLSEDSGRRVLLLEAGPDYPTLEQTPRELLDCLHPRTAAHDWGFAAEMVPGRRVSYPRGKVMGGSSAINAVVALWGVPADYDEWAAWGNTAWSWANVRPFCRRVEDDQDLPGDIHGAGGPIPIRRWRDDELLPMQRGFSMACQALGFPAVSDHNDPRASGVGNTPVNLRGGMRISTSVAYLLPARERPNLTIRPDCLVDRILVDGTRAVAVEFESTQGREQAFGHRITLSAGAIGSPAILLRSGIGPVEDLCRLGIEPAIDLPGVGANLIDHAGIRISLSPKVGGVDVNTPLLPVLLRYTAQGSVEQNDMQLHMFHPWDDTRPERVAQLTAKLMRPRSRGSLRLVNRDPHSPLDIRLNLMADPEDMRRMADSVLLMLALAESPTLAQHTTDQVRLDDGRAMSFAEATALLSSQEAREIYVRETVRHYVHPVGSARMGPADDKAAVVDQYCRVVGLERLRVVDASVMPNIPRANTNLTCIMIGERVADWMRTE